IVVLWPVAASHQIISLPQTAQESPQLAMEQPRFSGTDDQDRPFSLAAVRAVQHPDNLLMIDLETLQAQMTMADGTPVTGTAQMGRFDQDKKRLWLAGNVAIQQPSHGYHFDTNEMFVDFNQRAVWGDKPARLTGAFGSIEGQGFRVYDGGKVMLFTGESHAILNMSSGAVAPGSMLGK
ncbi:MAG: LPS export ABC transporter periplasmic protein LptC, partial [Hyphomicrobium sp.]